MSQPLLLSTNIPVYETYLDLPRRRPSRGDVSRAALYTMFLGCLFLVAGAFILAPQRTLSLVLAPQSVAALRPAALATAPITRRARVSLNAEEEDEDVGETLGDLLRGGPKSSGVTNLRPSSLADALAEDAKEAARAAAARRGGQEDEPDVKIPASSWALADAQVVEEERTVSRISFGVIALGTGLTLLSYGFGAYFQMLPGESLSAVMLIYGFPASLIGFALRYAELKPLECKSTSEALKLRDTQATDIQKQIREDVTRFRYGDEQHLEEAIDRIFKLGRPDGIPRNCAPTLVGIGEQVVDGEYALILNFENDDRVKLSQWTKRVPTFTTFFGPGIKAELGKTDIGVDMALICDGSGLGREGVVQGDAKPPLMPGLPARRGD